MTQTLSRIQTLMKIAKVISIIAIVFASIGLVCSVGAGLAFYFGGDEMLSMEFGESTVGETIFDDVTPNIESLYILFIVGAIACIVEIIISDTAKKYFKFEIKEGTPFTYEGAQKLKKFGILAIVLPLVGELLSVGVVFAFMATHSNLEIGDVTYGASIGVGVIALLFAVVFKHGAQLSEVQKQTALEKSALEKKQKQAEQRRGYRY